MQNSNLSHSQSAAGETRAGYEMPENLRRRSWAALLDLGLTDAEIAAYFGDNLELLRHPSFGPATGSKTAFS